MEELSNLPRDPEIEFAVLDKIIRHQPNLLDVIDKKHFADTPLHLAAAEGRTLLALEILMLMPSFGKKLNPDGFSPLHLALQRGHTKTVRAMIKQNPELVAVQRREGITPLHYTAETDNVDMLAEFLFSCPASIDKLTVRMESAVHVAVKNGKFAAFRVLFGFLERIDRKEILKWKDLNGNTVLHLAAATNQNQVMELLVKEVYVNDKNSKGLTALDIAMELPTRLNKRALQILQRRRAKRGSSIPDDRVDLSSKMTTADKHLKTVMTVLFATTAFLTVLNLVATYNIIRENRVDLLKTQREDNEIRRALSTNQFVASVGIIFLLLPPRRHLLILQIMLLFWVLGCVASFSITLLR